MEYELPFHMPAIETLLLVLCLCRSSNAVGHQKHNSARLDVSCSRCFLPLFAQLGKFRFGNSHQHLDLIGRALEVLDAESVHCDDFDTEFHADGQYLRERERECHVGKRVSILL